MKQPRKIFAVQQVDRGFSADRRIDCGQQRRRQLHEPDAAQIAAGGKSGEVADDPAAQRDSEVCPRHMRLAHRLKQVAEYADRLAVLACGDNEMSSRKARICERFLDSLQIERRHVFITDDHGTAGYCPFCKRSTDRLQQAAARYDRVLFAVRCREYLGMQGNFLQTQFISASVSGTISAEYAIRFARS